MNLPKRYLITSALPYANGPLHIGHLAGAYMSADIYSRYLRLMGKDVVYVCGSDEHGAAITIKAKKERTTPQAIVDKFHAMIEKTFKEMGVSFDIYHRTSAEIHHETSQEFFRDLYEKGEFEEKESDQYYDPEAKYFLADRYIIGTCPKCGNESAYGDQCENCGSTLSPTELINPKSTLSGAEPILKKTKHWYLPLNKYEDWLSKWIDTGELEGQHHHDSSLWKNHVIGQCKSWIDGGLMPRAMTRDLDWGVDVPQEIEGTKGKKLYVWMDAPIGYISATKEWAKENGKEWEPYWKDNDTSLVHFIGKDNIVFHCIIFPAILKAQGEYILPENVPANQFMNLEGDKLSTSRNWAVWVHEYLEDFPNQADLLRYHLIKNMPEQKDSEFTWKAFQESNNNDLVNNLGNFVNRVVVLTNKYYQGIAPEVDENVSIISASDSNEMSFIDSEMVDLFDELQILNDHIRSFNFRDALSKLMEISALGNQFLQYNEPWKIQKDDPELVKVTLLACLQFVAAISVSIRPFMPFTSDKLRQLLNLDPIKDSGDMVEMLNTLAEGEMLIPFGHQISKPIHIFSRIDDKVIEAQVDKLKKRAKQNKPQETEYLPISPEIGYDDFVKLDLRTATILHAEKIPKANKLLKISVDMGFEKRTIVSGIAKHFEAKDLTGKKIVVVSNLAARKMMGVESEGMILLAENSEGLLDFVSPSEYWPNGTVVK